MNITTKNQVVIENFALLFVSIIIGLIVSGVAQILIIAAQNLFEQLFLNPNFSANFNLLEYKLNLIPLMICLPASILVGYLLYIFEDFQ